MRFFIKIVVSALIIAGVSELSRRSVKLGSVFAALPLTSILVMCWLYADTGDVERVSQMSVGIFWALVPSFLFLLSLPWLLRRGVGFSQAMLGACALMVVGYAAYVWGMGRFGVGV